LTITKSKQVLFAAFKVTIFWWIIATAIYSDKLDFRSVQNFIVVILGALSGPALMCWFISSDRNALRNSLSGQTVRGMHSSIGAIPIHAKPLNQSEVFPPESEYPPESDKNFIAAWRAQMPEPMRILLDAVLKTLWAYPTYPAAPTTEDNPTRNHGGRSLTTHSLMVAWLMCDHAEHHTYEGPKINGNKLFGLLDPSYRFDAKDPLIPILGLAHDIGKIECLIWDKNGKAVDMANFHDLKGARIMARMDEFWNPGITAEDRRIMQAVLAHYHNAAAVPMRKDGSPTSDRLHALLELLIRCDRVASAVENGGKPEAAFANVKELDYFMADEGALEQMQEAIIQVLKEGGRINSRATGDPMSIGWKYFLPQYNKNVVALREDAFAIAVAQKMGFAYSKTDASGGENPLNHFTERLLVTLQSMDLLFNDHEQYDRAATGKIFQVSFYKPEEYWMLTTDSAGKSVRHPIDLPETKIKPQFSVGGAIFISPDAYAPLSFLSGMPDFNYVIHPGKSRMGRRGLMTSGTKRFEEPSHAINEADFDLEISPPESSKIKPKAMKSNTPSVIALKIAFDGALALMSLRLPLLSATLKRISLRLFMMPRHGLNHKICPWSYCAPNPMNICRSWASKLLKIAIRLREG